MLQSPMQGEAMNAQTMIEELLQAGMMFSARYVPPSERDEPDEADWEHFAWRIRLDFNGQTFRTIYRAGTAHVTGAAESALRAHGWNGFRHTVDSRRCLDGIIERGAGAKTPGPVDVLPCLVSDAFAALDAGDFEEFAREYGYDLDSRKAERSYRGCVKTALKLRRMFGEKLDAMREAFAEL